MTDKRIDWNAATDQQKCILIGETAGWDARKIEVAEHSADATYSGAHIAGVRLHPGCWAPDYLRDPRAWWPLVEEMGAEASDDKFFDVSCAGSRRGWAAGFREKYYEHWVDQGVAPTPAEAVCIAYLRSKGWTVTT